VACWQTECVKVISQCAVSYLALAIPLQKRSSRRRPGKNSCSEFAASTSQPALSARKVRCEGLRYCCQDDATILRSSTDEHRQQHKNRLPIALRKECSFPPCNLIVKKHPLPHMQATAVATDGSTRCVVLSH
jgi:hypothetical protein